MKLTMLLAGLFFLLNPNLASLDLLPDFVGYLLIFASLKELSALHPQIAEARDAFRSLTYVTLGKAGALIALFLMQSSSTGTFDNGWNLVLVFVFVILEILYSARAFVPFFEGLDSAQLRYGNANSEGGRANALSMTWVFLFTKHGLCLAAELPFLWESKTTGTVQSVELVTAQNFRYVLTLLNLVGGIILGVIWFVLLCTYLQSFRSKDFQNGVGEAYRQLLRENPRLLLRSRLKLCYKLISAGAICLFSFTAWNINLFPTALFGILSLVAVTLLRSPIPELDGLRALPSSRSGLIPGILFTVLSLARYTVSIVFFALYHTADEAQSYADIISVVIERERSGLVLMAILFALTVCEGVALVCYLHSLSRTLLEAARIYTAAHYETVQMASRNDEVIYAISRKLHIATLWCALLAVSLVAQQALLFVFPMMWFISMLVSVGAMVSTTQAVGLLAEETENRFLYE